jgi:uncharacterized protein YukE
VSARPGDWHLLGPSTDPVPGEPTEVERLARGYESTADTIARLAGRLRRLSQLNGWEGEAAEAFGESAEDLADDLAKAERRYRDLAAALRGWASPVSAARDESAGALRDAVAADEDRRRHTADLLAGVAEPTPAQMTAQEQQDAAHTAALGRLRDARDRLDTALDALDAAAARTAERIDAAAEQGADSWWDDAKGTVRDYAGVIARIADVLSYLAMGLAAITLIVVLVATAPAWLILAGVGASFVLAGLHTALVLSESGEATWTDVGLDLLGAATAGVGLPLASGVGKALAGLRTAAGRQLGANGRAAQETLEQGVANYGRAGNAMGIGNPSNPLRIWAQQYLDDAAARVAAKGTQEAARAEAGVITHAPWLPRLQTLDRDLARNLLEIERLSALPLSDDLLARLNSLPGRTNAAGYLGWADLGVQVADSGDQLSEDLGGPEALRWKDDVDRSAQNGLWRLTQGW